MRRAQALACCCLYLQMLDITRCDHIAPNAVSEAAASLYYAEIADTYFGLRPNPRRELLHEKLQVRLRAC